MSLRVHHLPSPWSSFFKETASFRWGSSAPGCDRTESMAWNRCWQRALEVLVTPLAYLDEVVHENISGAHWMLCWLIRRRWALVSSVLGEI